MNEYTTTEEVEIVTETKAETKQSRFRSWALWLSVLGAVGVILNAFGVFEKLGITSATFDIIVNAVGGVLIAFGIVNNPTNSGGI